MRSKIIANNYEHLKELIQKEIRLAGNQCSLNHIDVYFVEDLSYLFSASKFNGDISMWDVSNVENMRGMFQNSPFNGDISQWNVSKVKNMRGMFQEAEFNGNVSNWDVSNVKDMSFMFYSSEFNGDVSEWKPSKLKEFKGMFGQSKAPIPYWAKFDNNEDVKIAIEKYQLSKKLNADLNTDNSVNAKRVKI